MSSQLWWYAARAGGIVAWGDDRTTATSDLGVPVRAAVVEPRWDESATASRVAGDRLWIATGDSVRAYDLATRALVLDLVVPGAGAIAVVYPLLKRQYGIGAEKYGIDPSLAGGTGSGLTSPISVKWAGFAELLQGGISKLEPHALYALVIGVVLGIVITIFEEKHKKYLPSPTGIALGMLIPAAAMLPMLLGGITQAVWARVNPKAEETYNVPLASGLIVGEALLALLIPVLAVLGIMGGS